jgi:hypothetical protein
MIILYSNFLTKSFTLGSRIVNGFAFFPFIVVRRDLRGTIEAQYTINHERIHIRQQVELLLIIFSIWYIISYIKGRFGGFSKREAYRNIIFEREAYENMYDMRYLENRKLFSFLNYKSPV